MVTEQVGSRGSWLKCVLVRNGLDTGSYMEREVLRSTIAGGCSACAPPVFSRLPMHLFRVDSITGEVVSIRRAKTDKDSMED